MKVTHDKEIDAAYIYLAEIGDGEAARTIDVYGNCTVMLDYDADGRLLGIEVIGASELLRPETLAGATDETEG